MRRIPVLLALLAVTGCGSKPGDMPMGTVKLHLTDAPGTVEALHLVINEVSVHRSGSADDGGGEAEDDTLAAEMPEADDAEGGWEVISSEPMTVDLMTLRDGVTTTLGIALVPATRYTQIRLKLGEGSDVVVDGVTYPLVVPSGLQSGVKIVHPFTVPADGVISLLVDFDGAKSVIENGAGTWMLKPTIKVTQSSE
jgi:hypothetical protein